MIDGDHPTGLRCDGRRRSSSRRCRRCARAARGRWRPRSCKPFDRSAGLVFFGAVGLALILVAETVAAALVLDQALVDAFYGAVKTLVTVDPNPEVQDGPKWFKVVISLSMLIALLFAAAFTGGLVERLIGRNLTGLLGRRAVPRSDHVVVVGLGQVGLRLCILLRELGISTVVAVDDQPDGENVGHARQLGIPVVIGRGADPSLLRRLSLERAIALAAVTADDLQNIKVVLAARAESGGLRVVLRAGSNAIGGETNSLERLGHVRDVHRIGAVYIAGLALGSAAATSSSTATRRTCAAPTAALERCAYPVAG